MKVLDQAFGRNWVAYHADCVEVVKALPSECIDFSIFSPPFGSLYTYSNSDRDMGNSRVNSQFYRHFRFLTKELFRVLKPGRNLVFHCMNIPAKKERDGFIGIKEDFRGDLIRIFKWAGFIHYGEVVVWKDPVVAQQRTNALTLLHKQIITDSTRSAPGLPDYMIVMQKPGINPERVAGAFDGYHGTYNPIGEFTNYQDSRNGYSVDVWQQYASPVWMDINPNDTLNGERGKRRARSGEDELHICPLQLTPIRRFIQMYTNPDDVVLTPFGGIGSEGYCAVEMGRKAILIELKKSYFKELVSNMRTIANDEVEQLDLLEFVA